MSIPRGFGLNGKSIYMNVAKPMIVECSFIVDAANGNGLGIRSLKSNGYIENVFMHTSTTPGSNNGHLNPNPAAGYALVQFKNNFNVYLGGFSGFGSPVSGTPINVTTGTTLGLAYIIVSVGTTSVAQWQKLGLPPGITPAVGVSFIAKATTTATGTGVIEVPSNSGILSSEVIGNPNLSINSAIGANAGQYVLVQFLGATDASTTTLIPKAPADNSVAGMSFWFDGSTVTVDGL